MTRSNIFQHSLIKNSLIQPMFILALKDTALTVEEEYSRISTFVSA